MLAFASLTQRTASQRCAVPQHGCNFRSRRAPRSVSCRAKKTKAQPAQQQAEPRETQVPDNGAPSTSRSGVSAALADAEAAVRDGTFDISALENLIPEAISEVEDLVTRAETAEAAHAKSEEEAKANQDRYLRLNADFDNFRKRSVVERDQIGDRIRGDVIKSLVPLVDSFEAAQNSIKAETENEQKIAAAYQGLYKQMVETFKSLGVEATPGVGEPFDPEFHDAIMREPSEEVADGTVLQEFRRGFRLGKVLLRPGMVKVSFTEAPASSPSEALEEEIAVGSDSAAE